MEKVLDDKYHQDIENLIKNIEQEEQDLFIGEIGVKEPENEEDVQMEKLSLHDSQMNENNEKDNVNMENSKISNKDEQKVMI